MTRIAFADESGIHKGAPCYGIGVVSVRRDHLDAFNNRFDAIVDEHNIAGELKWEDIGNRRSDINAIIDLVTAIVRSRTAFFDVIVVNTKLYRNWKGSAADKETAFYKTYTQLLRHMAGRTGDIAEVSIDNRPDKYPHHVEVVEKVANHMLVKLASSGRLKDVRKVESQTCPGIQVADLLTGVVVAAHSRSLDPGTPLNQGKRVAIQRVARIFDWDDLRYDTMPDSRFNIWHFPQEWRASPETRVVRCCRVPYVTRTDL